MQPVLERGSIDIALTFDGSLIQLSFIPVCSPNTCSQIVPRVCTLVRFIMYGRCQKKFPPFIHTKVSIKKKTGGEQVLNGN